MKKTRIFTPGPTPLIPEAQVAMAQPLIHHRTPEFSKLFLETREALQKIFQTENDIIILASSGTGAMESAVSNLLGPEDQALAVVTGKFGERWTQICEAFGVPCLPLCKEYGQAASAEEISAALAANPGVRAVLLQGCETSTATAHDLGEIGLRLQEEHPDVFLVVDAITALGSQPLEPDLWGLDIVIGGSQKSFGMSPGLAFLSVSSRALKKMEAVRGHRFYFDLVKEVQAQRKGQTAYTPSVTLVGALNAASKLFLTQGLDAIIREAETMARATRAGLLALGFRMLSENPANAVTAAYPPPGIDAKQLSSTLEESYGTKVAGGQGSLKGKIIRIAHLGYFDILDVFSVLSAIEFSLIDLGHPLEPGAGLRAAMNEAVSAIQAVSAAN